MKGVFLDIGFSAPLLWHPTLLINLKTTFSPQNLNFNTNTNTNILSALFQLDTSVFQCCLSFQGERLVVYIFTTQTKTN